ncbi:hypothetical protein [Shewanella algae]|uniref:hypothetical protein n=1 Tax=Shewanella algae TaxID=38313 RepID=UPI001AACCFCA|nr:hypothetical protein [Shewanella algae]MBO2629533.1 hypothetical protein [Shewanella algae]QTE93758.1 hypothetical protein JKK45_15005 [Shewanella algae]
MEVEEIPSPDSSGISGGQKTEGNISNMVGASPLEGLHLAKTITGLTSSHSRAFGGEVASAVIAGATTQLHIDHQDLKNKYEKLAIKLEEQRNELETIRTKNAVLIQKIKGEAATKHLRNFAITIGTSIVASGIFLSRNQFYDYAYGAYFVGVILLVLGWYTGPTEDEK